MKNYIDAVEGMEGTIYGVITQPATLCELTTDSKNSAGRPPQDGVLPLPLVSYWTHCKMPLKTPNIFFSEGARGAETTTAVRRVLGSL